MASSPFVVLLCYMLMVTLAICKSDSEPETKNVMQRASNWGVMRGSWGKRDWTNARGMWGKRGGQDLDEVDKRNWNRANGMWGKRGLDLDDDDQQDEKRGWEKASGMWGKRAGANWNTAKGMWGRRKRAI